MANTIVIIATEKDKNLIKFYNSTEKVQYVYDISTKRFTNVVSKRKLQSCPKGVEKFLSNKTTLSLMERLLRYGNDNANLWEICERLDALNREYTSYYGECSTINEYADLLLTNWKKIVKYINAKPLNEKINLDDMIKELKKQLLANALPSEYLTRLNDKSISALGEAMLNYSAEPWWKDEYLTVMAYWFVHQVADYYCFEEEICEMDDSVNRFGGRRISLNPYRSTYPKPLTRVIKDTMIPMIQIASKYGVDLKKSNYFRMLVDLRKMYATNAKHHSGNDEIKHAYEKYLNILSFTENGYTVVIPQTIDDFRKEAVNMNNCVYSYYTNRVINNETLVVFIRPTDNLERSTITCEVNIYNGSIIQFLGRNNSYVRDEALLDFKHDYEKRLNEMWRKVLG